jgi:hypothetical protein
MQANPTQRIYIMKYKAMIGAMALTLGLATVSHAQQATMAKDTTKKAAVTSTTTKKHARRHKHAAKKGAAAPAA